jgi:hypothetical protein
MLMIYTIGTPRLNTCALENMVISEYLPNILDVTRGYLHALPAHYGGRRE